MPTQIKGESGIDKAQQDATGVTPLQFDSSNKLATTEFVRNELLGLGDTVYDAIFDKSLTANGYQKLPSGLIIQWGGGTYVAAGSGGSAVTLPITFPNAINHCLATKADATGGSVSATVTNTSSIKIYPAVAGSCFWLAIGY